MRRSENENDALWDVAKRPHRGTTSTSWLRGNAEYPEIVRDKRCHDVPRWLARDVSSRHWRPQVRGHGEAIGRMYSATPPGRERFCASFSRPSQGPQVTRRPVPCPAVPRGGGGPGAPAERRRVPGCIPGGSLLRERSTPAPFFRDPASVLRPAEPRATVGGIPSPSRRRRSPRPRARGPRPVGTVERANCWRRPVPPGRRSPSFGFIRC